MEEVFKYVGSAATKAVRLEQEAAAKLDIHFVLHWLIPPLAWDGLYAATGLVCSALVVTDLMVSGNQTELS